LKQDSSSGYAALRQGAGLIEAPETGRILVSGADRRSYLQGLLTNDVLALSAGTGCYASMLTAQGRMMTDMRVLELGDAILMDLPLDVVAPIRDHLERFVFTEDVQAVDVTAARAEIGVDGPRAAEALTAAGIERPHPSVLYDSTHVSVAGADAILVCSDRPGVRGYDLIVDAGQASAVRARLIQAGATPATEADVETVRIESGRPRFGRDMDTDTIPLEAGIEERAISRSKGCYVGQEVIVRVVDRGHGRVARRLVGLALAGGEAVPSRGARLRSGDREIGRVTSATDSTALGQPIALGYLHRDFAAEGTQVDVEGAGAATVVATPFAG
jgi:folate-binding protein YgfZ